MNLCSGWTPDTTASLRAAVAAVADANPLLTGRIAKAGDDFMVLPSVFNIDDIFKTTVGPSDYAIPSALTDQIKSMQTFIEPMFEPFTLSTDMASGKPLFRCTVMTLSPGDVCFCIELSHIIGDGATYYRMCDHINTAINGGVVPQTMWKPAGKDVGVPTHFSEEDAFTLAGGWVPAFLERKANEPARESLLNVLNSAAILALKPKLLAAAGPSSGVKFLSSNDVIVAGVAEVMKDLNGCTLMMANVSAMLAFKQTSLTFGHVRP
jgi:hypothetical protein